MSIISLLHTGSTEYGVPAWVELRNSVFLYSYTLLLQLELLLQVSPPHGDCYPTGDNTLLRRLHPRCRNSDNSQSAAHAHFRICHGDLDGN